MSPIIRKCSALILLELGAVFVTVDRNIYQNRQKVLALHLIRLTDFRTAMFSSYAASLTIGVPQGSGLFYGFLLMPFQFVTQSFIDTVYLIMLMTLSYILLLSSTN